MVGQTLLVNITVFQSSGAKRFILLNFICSEV